MIGYRYHRNTSVMHCRTIEAIRHRSNDERRADWYAKYCLRGFHRGDGKPRVRIATVPANLPASPDIPSREGLVGNSNEVTT